MADLSASLRSSGIRKGEIYEDPQVYGSLEGRTVGETYILKDFRNLSVSDHELTCEVTPLNDRGTVPLSEHRAKEPSPC